MNAIVDARSSGSVAVCIVVRNRMITTPLPSPETRMPAAISGMFELNIIGSRPTPITAIPSRKVAVRLGRNGPAHAPNTSPNACVASTNPIAAADAATAPRSSGIVERVAHADRGRGDRQRDQHDAQPWVAGHAPRAGRDLVPPGLLRQIACRAAPRWTAASAAGWRTAGR